MGITVDHGAFQVTLVVKNLSANAGNVGDTGSTPGSGRCPGGGHGNPLQYSSLENHHGHRCLEGYSPRGCKESDMTERLSTQVLIKDTRMPPAIHQHPKSER